MILVDRIFATLSVASSVAFSWGSDGHFIVAKIAEARLSMSAAIKVRNSLDNIGMVQVANWADDYRHTEVGSWSTTLHFADLPDRDCHFQRARDCKRELCVAGAISNYTQRLVMPDGSFEPEALKFLIHFVADGHQPLHVGFLSDRGGNDIKIHTCFKMGIHCNSENLHEVWDSVLLKQAESEMAQPQWIHIAETLMSQLSEPAFSDYVHYWASACSNINDHEACSNAIVGESGKQACEVSYLSTNDRWVDPIKALERDYYASRILTVNMRLMAAGVRLATLLNDAAQSTVKF